jgi:hypothetical protein
MGGVALGLEHGLDLAADLLAMGQRVWKRQPLGGSMGEGTSPRSRIRSRLRRGSGSGIPPPLRPAAAYPGHAAPRPHPRCAPHAETLGHAGLASVAAYTKIREARRRKALEAVEEAGL